MKIKNYLDIIDKLPEMPFQNERVEFAYMDKHNINDKLYEATFNKIEFIQVSYKDSMNRIKYKWEMVGDNKIDYKVDDMYIKSSNDLIFATLIDLTYRYKFKNWTCMTSNIKSCYINFKEKFWAIDDSRYEKFYYINNSKIMENIFIESLNEYPNGVPIVWED